jgi:hypothetical protein
VFSSTNPTGGIAAWTNTRLPITLDGLACPTATLCVGEDVASDITWSNDPTGAASTWKEFSVGARNHLGGAVACPTQQLCVAVAVDQVITSTNP